MRAVVDEPEGPAAETGYLLDNSAPEAGERFDSLAALFNSVAFRHFEMLGISEGWCCWELGVGGPSVPRWLSDRVGRSGRVLATDIDVRWVQGPLGDNVEVRRHDVAEDDPPPGPFDLVHERLVLIHVQERERSLRQMVGALRSGGRLLVEDFDSNLQPFACPDSSGPEQRRANKIRAGIRVLLASRGADLELGRRLPRLLREAGLVDVAADAYLPIALPAASALEQANVSQVGDELVAAGLASAEEVGAHLKALATGSLDVATPPLVSAWGRKP
jgi:SAM-dependent methyltransferase